MTKKKICIVSEHYWEKLRGGSEYQLYLLAKELIKKDYSVFYICVGKNNYKHNAKIKLLQININKLIQRIFYHYKFLLFFNLLNILREINPDIIISRPGDAFTGICAFYTKKNNCKMIWHISSLQDVLPFKFRCSRTILFDIIDKKLLEFGIKNSDYIIAQAEYQNKLLELNYGRKCDLIVSNFHPLPQCTIKKENPIKIVWINNIKPQKQPEYFIWLAEKFKHRSDLKFVMIGRAEKERYKKTLISKMQNIDNLEYKGELSIEEVNKQLCETHILVNTSKYEGFPNTFIQAWMRNVPVVSLQVDPDDVLKKKKVGFYSGSFRNLIKDVLRLIENSKLREEMGQRARNYAIENHMIEKNINRIVKLIEK